MESGYEVEILVVDGGSTDNTRQIGHQLGARVITESRKGYGRAYKTGFQEANGDIIVTMDADDTYPAELIGEYIEKLIETDSDFITINRFARMERRSMSFVHKIGNKILSKTMNLIFSNVVNDSQSGMWIMKKAFANQINLVSDDMCLSEEIKIIAFEYFRAKELPGHYSERTGSAKLATLRHGWVNFRYLFSYRKLIKYAIRSTELVSPPVFREHEHEYTELVSPPVFREHEHEREMNMNKNE
jgi:glycosyltransferase involved in cell wall biosynthesis